ncbi:hypothetical protein BsWGS_00669 [Bradybaena similaris]
MTPRCSSHVLYTVQGRGISTTFVLFWLALILAGANGSKRSRSPVNISAVEQQARLEEAHLKCLQYILYQPTPATNGTYCPRDWDDVLCWPDTAAGEVAVQPCPDYINGFKPWENASRSCMGDGTWFFHDVRNRTWTDLRSCTTRQYDDAITRAEFIKSHMGTIKQMYNSGYGISLASLVVSVIIMLSFRRLHCPRNSIHINLFASFILRASFSFMKENILVEGVGFASDVITDGDAPVVFKNESSHWECKLFFTCFYYILAANYMWIFAEAVYLHMLITVAVFSEKSSVKWYALLGWASPVLFVVPWVIVRAKLEDVYCWNTHPTPGYFWIMRGPIVLSIVINFLFFLNIIRVLFTKLNAVHSPEAKKYRKLAKSTLVLIPLFGVHYIVFAWLPKDVHPVAELVQLYFEMFFNSFQGFFVALLFCFLNGEVQGEIRKKWHRFRLTHLHKFPKSRKNSQSLTLVTYLSRGRESNASVTYFQENRRDSSSNGFIKGVNSLNRDMTTNSFPLKTYNNVKISDNNVILESEETEPMIQLTGFSSTESPNLPNGFS